MSFTLSKRSWAALSGVHPELVKVVGRAIELTTVDFAVTEGLRTLSRQMELKAAGASMTLESRHLTGHAIDVAAFIGKEVRWDWPLYGKIAIAMKQAAKELGVSLEWGGDWKKFPDGPHFQLSKKDYP